MADRFGPRWLIAGGLAIVSASLYSFSGIAVDSGYLDLLPGFMLLGIGIALTMSPMTSAAMNAVAVEKAGIASGVLSMFRMVGGSLGVAVTGAIFQGLISPSSIATSPAPASPRRSAPSSPTSSAAAPAKRCTAWRRRRRRQVVAAGQEAFVYALGHAMTVSGAVALTGAVVGATAIRAKRKSISTEAAEAAVNPGGSELAATRGDGRRARRLTLSVDADSVAAF